MASTWRTIRVFLSSTFRDMHAERDHLIKVTFPALREKLLPYRVELRDIDLRWGITEDETQNQKVIHLCLEQVDQCRPFFLAFLGHRYGWVPDKVPEETQQHFPMVTRYPGASVTELELRHAVLDGPPRAMHVLFCLRDRSALATIPEATRFAQFAEQDPRIAQQLEKLKEALAASGYPLREYTCRWDPDAWDRPTRCQGRLVDLVRFGEMVEEWLARAIREELQLAEEPPAVDPLDEEADLHEKFLESRRRIYVGRGDLNDTLHTLAWAEAVPPVVLQSSDGHSSTAVSRLIRTLRHWLGFGYDRDDPAEKPHASASGNHDTPCLLVGSSGIGKSAALAQFVHTFRHRHPEAIVLPHFVGASPHTTSLHGLLGRLCQELERRLGFEGVVPDDLAGRIKAFLGLLASVPEGRRVVLVLDGLNQLDGETRSLHWLPERLMPHVKVIASTVTGPGRLPENVGAFGQRPCRTLEVQPLTDKDRRDLLSQVPRLAAKTLDEAQVSRLLANPATVNPLFLRTTLEELRVYGSFSSLDARIDALPREADALTALFEQVFQRLEDEFERDLVGIVLSLLACARRGLTEPELLALTRDCRGANELLPLLRQLRPYLLSRAARVDFYHINVRRAAFRYYLKRDPDATLLQPTAEERLTRQRLIAHFRPERLKSRGIEELPWQMAELRAWQGLVELLAEPAFVEAAWKVNEFEVRETWARVEAQSPLRMVNAYQPVVANPAAYEASQVWDIAELLFATGYLSEAQSLRAYLSSHYQGRNEERFAANLRVQGLILYWKGDLDAAMQCHKEAELIFRRLDNLAKLSGCLNNQAVILQMRGDMAGALRLHKHQEEICRRLDDFSGLASSLGNQAIILKARGDLETAMRTFKQAEEVFRRLNHLEGLQTTLGNQGTILQAQRDLDGAMRLHKQEEEICRRINDPVGLIRSLGHQAEILRRQGDSEGGMRLHKQVEEICRRLNQPTWLSDCLLDQAVFLRAQRDSEGALRLLKEVEDICRSIHDQNRMYKVFGTQALVLEDQGHPERAMQLHRQVEEVCRELANQNGLWKSLANQARLLQQEGDMDCARRRFKQAEEICRELGAQHGLCQILDDQAAGLRAQGDPEGAMRLLQEKDEICRKINDPVALSDGMRTQALILSDQGDLKGAMRLLKQVDETCRSLNHPDGLQLCLSDQAEILWAQGELEEAVRAYKEQEEVCRRLHNFNGVATSLTNQASLVAYTLRQPKRALRLIEEAYQLAIHHGLGKLVEEIKPILQEIRQQAGT